MCRSKCQRLVGGNPIFVTIYEKPHEVIMKPVDEFEIFFSDRADMVQNEWIKETMPLL